MNGGLEFIPSKAFAFISASFIFAQTTHFMEKKKNKKHTEKNMQFCFNMCIINLCLDVLLFKYFDNLNRLYWRYFFLYEVIVLITSEQKQSQDS